MSELEKFYRELLSREEYLLSQSAKDSMSTIELEFRLKEIQLSIIRIQQILLENINKSSQLETKLQFSLDELIDFVKYGFDYHRDSQNDNISVPIGNILQQIMYKKNLMDIPTEFKKYK